MDAQSKQTKIMGDASEKQSKAALDASIGMARTDQRAWLDLTIAPPTYFASGKPFATTAELKNLGKTPAKNISVAYLFLGAEKPYNITVDDAKLPTVKFGMLPPQGPAGFPVEITPGKPEEALTELRYEAIRSGNIEVFSWGLIKYDDIFNEHHWIQFCYIYNVPHARFNLCAMHNAMDEPAPKGKSKQ